MEDRANIKKIFLIRSKDDALRLKNLAGRPEGIKIVASEYIAAQELQKNGFSFEESGYYLARSRYKGINMEAIKLAKSWFRQSARILPDAPVTHDGISLGDLIFEEMAYYFVEIIKEVLLLKVIIEREKPRLLFLFKDAPSKIRTVAPLQSENFFAESASLLCGISGVGLEFINDSFARQTSCSNEGHISKHNLTPHLKKALFIVYTQFYKLWRPLARKRRRAILFFMPWRYIDSTAKKIQKGKKYRLIFMQESSILSKVLTEEGIIQIWLNGYKNDAVKKKAAAANQVLRSRWGRLKSDKAFRCFFVIDNIPLWEVVKSRLEFIFTEYFGVLIEKIEIIKRIIEVEKVRLLVLSNDLDTAHKIFAVTARKMGIRSLVVQHGLVGDMENSVEITSDRIAVWGSIHEERLLGLGVPAEKIVITGCPRFDVYFKPAANSVNARYLLGGSFNPAEYSGMFVLIGECGEGYYECKHFLDHEYSFEDTRQYLKAVFRTMRNFPQKLLVLKNKPNDKYSLLAKNLAREIGLANVAVVEDVDLPDLLKSCQLLISSQSTVILEAMILNKPVITVNLRGRDDIHPFAQQRLAIGVYRADDLPSAISKILNERPATEEMLNNQKRMIPDYIFKEDGQASRRVADLIENMAAYDITNNN